MGKSAPMFEIIYQTVQDNDNDLSVEMLCGMAGVSRSGYYAWWQLFQVEHAEKRKIEQILN